MEAVPPETEMVAPAESRERIYTFRGQDVILIDGAITTPERFAKWQDSIAHVFEDGSVWCYGAQIGTRDELLVPTDRYTETSDPDPATVLEALLFSPTGLMGKP